MRGKLFSPVRTRQLFDNCFGCRILIRKETEKENLGERQLCEPEHLPDVWGVRVPPRLAGVEIGMILRLEIKEHT